MPGPRSPASWLAPGPALARDHHPFPARPEGGSRRVGAAWEPTCGALHPSFGSPKRDPRLLPQPEIKICLEPGSLPLLALQPAPRTGWGARDWVRWGTSSGSPGLSGPLGLARGELPPSAPVPAYPREPTSLPSPPSAIFPDLLSCPSDSAPPTTSLNSFPDLHVCALPARIPASRDQLLTPSAEDTWLSPAPSPYLDLSFPRYRVGSKPERIGDAGACAQAFPFLWGKTGREPTQGYWSSRPQTAPRGSRVRPRPSRREDGQVQCPDSPLPECRAPPRPQFPPSVRQA